MSVFTPPDSCVGGIGPKIGDCISVSLRTSDLSMSRIISLESSVVIHLSLYVFLKYTLVL